MVRLQRDLRRVLLGRPPLGGGNGGNGGSSRLQRDLRRVVLGAGLIGLALPLASYAIVGWFSRYASDDYCTAATLVEQGFWGAQAYWYTAWSGRFAFFALVTAMELGGIGAAQVLPGLALLGGVLAITWALVPLAEHAGWRPARLIALVLAELVVFGIYASTPNLGQSLLWQTGVLTYSLPLILLAVFIGWLGRAALWQARATPAALGGSAALLCVAGGLSETTLTLQIAALGLALLGVLVWRRGGALEVAKLLLAGLVGSLVAAAILGLAPGNAERVVRSEYPGAQLANLPLAARASFRLLGGFARRFEAEVRPVLLVCLGLSAATGVWVSRCRASRSWSVFRAELPARGGTVVLLVAGAGLLVATSFFPSYWILGFDPPARVEVVAQAILVCAAVGLGYVVGRAVGHAPLGAPLRRGLRIGVGVASLGLLLVPVSVAAAQMQQLPQVAGYTAQWDRNDQLLRQRGQAGAQEVVVPKLPDWWGWAWVGPQATDFPNGCVARYYGVGDVRSQ